jgi:hypothetical protein
MTYSRFLQGSLPLLVELDMAKRASAAGDKGVAPPPSPTAPPAEVSPKPSSTTPTRPKRPGGIPKPGEVPSTLQQLLQRGAGSEQDFKIRTHSGIAGARG